MTGAAESINEPAMRLPNTIALNFVFIELPLIVFALNSLDGIISLTLQISNLPAARLIFADSSHSLALGVDRR